MARSRYSVKNSIALPFSLGILSVLTPLLFICGSRAFNYRRDKLYREASFAIELFDGIPYTTRDDWKIAYERVLRRQLDSPGRIGNTRDLSNEELRAIIGYARSIENK